MSFLFGAKLLTAILLVITFYLLCAGQALHTLLVMCRRDTRGTWVRACYELLLFFHLVMGAATANSLHAGYGIAILRLKTITIPIEMLLWVNIAGALIAAYLFVKEKNRGRKCCRAIECILLVLCTPPLTAQLGEASVYLLIVDASYLFFRVTSGLAADKQGFSQTVTNLSVVSAVNTLPEGVICAGDDGRILFMNDTMRSCLTSLGFATDLTETRTMWNDLEEIAKKGETPLDALLPEGIRLQISPDETRLFVRDRVILGKKEYRRMVALDVTEQEALNTQLAYTNHLLETSNAELTKSISNVAQVAHNEAILHMKARVHDTIGQRLSILHRYLEDDDLDEKHLAQITELLSHIIDDLTDPEEIPTVDENVAHLSSVESSFSLIGITLETQGMLPENALVASTFVKIIREAATNAAKHGRAKRVIVRFSEKNGQAILTVENDGAHGSKDMREGSGFPLMRAAMKEIQGTLRVVSVKPFIIEASAPLGAHRSPSAQSGIMDSTPRGHKEGATTL